MSPSPFPLGRVQQHDARSLLYPATTDVAVTNKTWRRYGYPLDQGDLGSCTGNAGVGALNHAPFHAAGTYVYKQVDARSLYSAATAVDPFPGVWPIEDTGSSGLAVAQVLKTWGTISSYTHAFGLDHILAAAMKGPLMIGTNWMTDMFWPDLDGLVYPTGSLAGGHEYVLDGVDVTHKILRFQNSWGSGWGDYGKFYMRFADFDYLVANGGDAVLLAK